MKRASSGRLIIEPVRVRKSTNYPSIAYFLIREMALVFCRRATNSATCLFNKWTKLEGIPDRHIYLPIPLFHRPFIPRPRSSFPEGWQIYSRANELMYWSADSDAVILRARMHIASTVDSRANRGGCQDAVFGPILFTICIKPS